MKKSIFSILLILSLSVTPISCKDSAFIDNSLISVIVDPIEISSDLQQKKFFLYKNVGDGSVVSIQSLNLMILQTYTEFDFFSHVDVSPDGSSIVFLQSVKQDEISPVWLYYVDLNNNRKEKIAGWDADQLNVSLRAPGFSFDGNQIYFSITWYEKRKNNIGVVDIDGNNLKIINTDTIISLGPEPSPDGSLIIVTCEGVNTRTDLPGFQLCLLDKDGKYIEHLTYQGNVHGSPTFSPDGNMIVFTEYDAGGLFGVLNPPKDSFYILDIETGETTLLLNWEVAVEGFSDDSSTIILQGRPDMNSPWALYLINVDGTNLRHLTYFDEFLENWYAGVEEY